MKGVNEPEFYMKATSSTINRVRLTPKGSIMLTYEDFGQPTRHLKRYLKLIETQALPKKVKGDYLEEHHIYPRCIFGDTDQLVVLNLRAHFIAHELIWRHYKEIKHPKANKLAYPLNRMKSAVKNQHSTTEKLRVTSRMAEIARRSMHDALIGKNNPFYGKKHSPEALAKMSAKQKGKIISEETRQKIGITSKQMWEANDGAKKKEHVLRMTGHIKTAETRKKLSEANKGKILSEDTRQKISIANKGKLLGIKKSDETRKKMSKAQTGRKMSEELIERINRDPEKIRKTAEKHRGMKRSAETCRKISEKAKLRTASTKGRVFYYDLKTLEVICIHKDDIPPVGYIRGNPNIRGANRGIEKEWWHDPITRVSKKLPKEGEKPEGWKIGKIKKAN